MRQILEPMFRVRSGYNIREGSHLLAERLVRRGCEAFSEEAPPFASSEGRKPSSPRSGRSIQSMAQRPGPPSRSQDQA